MNMQRSHELERELRLRRSFCGVRPLKWYERIAAGWVRFTIWFKRSVW